MKRIRLVNRAPYVGLRPYTEKEALLFFGRDAHVQDLLARLERRQRFLAVLGASGSGKSSLVRAGLIPALHRGALPPLTLGGDAGSAQGLARWNVCIFTPGDAPLSRLAQALAADPRWADRGLDAVDARASLAAALGNGPLALADLYRHRADLFAGEALLLVVDQFEEVFRYRQRIPDEADRFVQLLLRSATEPLPIYVVVTMRSDFLGQASAMRGLAGAINNGIYLTPRLDADSIRSVITSPLALAGGSIDPVLATRLLNTLAGDDELPVLQHALLRMWNRAHAAGRTSIEHEDFAAVCTPRDAQGQAAGDPALPQAIDHHASEIFDALTPAQQAAARTCFLALAERRDGRDVRRPRKLAELQALVPPDGHEALRAVIEAYRAPGVAFLYAGANAVVQADDVVDIGHESLIRRWRRYQAWLRDEDKAVAELRDLHNRALLQAQGGGWLDRNDSARAQAWRARVTALGLPAAWAAQYIDAEAYGRVDAYIAASQAQLDRQQAAEEALRRGAEEARVRQLEAEALRQQEAAQASRQRSRLWFGCTLVAVGFMLVAAVLGWKAHQARLVAEAHSLADVAEAEGRGNPDLGVLLALEAHAIAPVPKAVGLLRAAQATYDYRHVLRAHTDRVTGAQFSAGGQVVLTTSVDRTARLWDAATGVELEPRLQTEHQRTVVGAQFSPDDKTVLTWSEDGTARLTERSTGVLLKVLQGHDGPLTSAMYSEDGTKVLTAGEDGTVRLWDAASGRQLQQRDAWSCPVRGAQFLGGGESVLVLDGHFARVWSLTANGPSQLLMQPGQRVRQARVSEGGSKVLTVTDAGTAVVWTLVDGQPVGQPVILESAARITGGRLSADGLRAVTTGDDRRARLWDAVHGKLLHELGRHEDDLTSARWSHDGRHVATADAEGNARVWEARTGAEVRALRGHDNVINDVVFSPDGRTLVSASWDRTARLWDVSPGASPLLGVLRGHAGPVHAVEFSPDGSRLVSGGEDRTVRLWDVTRAQPLEWQQQHDGPVRSVQWSRDGGSVLSASEDGTARLWGLAAGAQVRVLPVQGGVLDAQFSPGGGQVVTAGADKSVRLWDLAGGGTSRALQPHAGPVFSAQYAPDGRTVVTASDDKQAWLHDLADGKAVRPLRGHGRPVLSARFSSDGRTVVTSSVDGTARLWDVASAVERRMLRGHSDAVRSAVLSADGRTVLTAGEDRTLRLWDAASGTELLALRGHGGPVLGARIGPDGRTVASASEDGTLRLWRCDPCTVGAAQAIDDIGKRVGRKLTAQERQRFGLRPDPSAAPVAAAAPASASGSASAAR